jgi:hypothetical protein
MSEGKRRVVSVIVAWVAVAAAGAGSAVSAPATTVDCNADPAALGPALAAAADGDTLTIVGTCTGIGFEVAHSVTLTGSGGAGLSATPSGSSEGQYLLTIAAGATVSISGLTLDGSSFGAGVLTIDAGATVSIVGVTVTGGAMPFGTGGGIFNAGTLRVTNSTITRNGARVSGAGIDNGGSLTLVDSTVSDNACGAGVGGCAGSGIANGGTAEIAHSTITGNRAGGESFGGGIANGGTLQITDSTVSGNVANVVGGGIANGGALVISNSTISGNVAVNVGGGGIYNGGTSAGEGATATITNSTISGNHAVLFGPLTEGGGAVLNHGGATLRLANSTISGNSGGDIAGISNFGAYAGSSVTIENTLLAGQTDGLNCGGDAAFVDTGYNLEDAASCGFSTLNHSLPNSEPLLDPAGLQDNGGPTQTIALQSGSPAIDAIPAGANGCGTTITTDQRGVSRPQAGGCDIGAYELTQTTPPELLAALATAVNGVGPGTSLADKVARAIAYLNSADTGDACSTLTAFANEVGAQSGKTIPADTAATLLADAQKIKSELGC